MNGVRRLGGVIDWVAYVMHEIYSMPPWWEKSEKEDDLQKTFKPLCSKCIRILKKIGRMSFSAEPLEDIIIFSPEEIVWSSII